MTFVSLSNVSDKSCISNLKLTGILSRTGKERHHNRVTINVLNRMFLAMSVPDNSTNIILVIEDDESIAEMIHMLLAGETGYHVLRFTHGHEALRAIQTVKPALFIVDYQLPSMTGLQFVDRLQTMSGFQHVPVLMMSANLPWDELSKRHITGIKKPFNLDDFLLLIEQTLHQS